MNYTIRVSDDNKYIILEVTGKINRDLAMTQNTEAHKLGREKGIDRYLVDMREARNTDSEIAQYQFAYYDMKHEPGIDRNALVALVVEEGDHSHDDLVKVARNSGLRVKLFTDMNEAEEYLR